MSLGSKLAPLVAAADDTSSAVAQRLFDDAKAAMAQQRYAEACKMFAESHHLDPATGGTLLNLAACNEKLGKIATAWAEYEEAALLARHYGRPDREKLARERSLALGPQVSMLVLQAPAITVPDMVVSVDGVAVGRPAWTGIPVDPGDHVVSLSAPGRVPWTTHVTVGSTKESVRQALPALEDAPLKARPPEPPPPPGPPPPPESTGSGRTAGFLLGGIGIPVLGVGALFGITAIQRNHASEKVCARGCASDPDGQQALVDANISNVAIGVGALAIAVGTYLVLTSPPRSSPRRVGWRSVDLLPSLSNRGASLGMGGRW